MSASPFQTYLSRSVDIFRRNTAKVLRMEPQPNSTALPIFSFTDAQPPVNPPSDFATGSDIDIGGLSTNELTAVPSQEAEGGLSHIAFHGNMSLAVPPQYAGQIRTGYAGFRNKSRPSLFGDDTWNLDLYSHIKVEVAYRGLEAWRSRWVVNIQTAGPVKSDLFQHRLDLPSNSTSTQSGATLDPLHCTGLQFTTLYLPISSFLLTNMGTTSEVQITMMRQKVRTFGFALLGGGRDDAIAPTPAQQAAIERGRIMAAGGFGRPGVDEEPDAELEELLASDRPAGMPAPSYAKPAVAGAYHRVGSAGPAPVLTPHALDREGYYELCVRSVEAVNYDPEMD